MKRIVLSLIAISVLGNATPHPTEPKVANSSELIAPAILPLLQATVRFLLVFFTVDLVKDVALDKVKELADTDDDVIAYINSHPNNDKEDFARGLAMVIGEKMNLRRRKTRASLVSEVNIDNHRRRKHKIFFTEVVQLCSNSSKIFKPCEE